MRISEAERQVYTAAFGAAYAQTLDTVHAMQVAVSALHAFRTGSKTVGDFTKSVHEAVAGRRCTNE